MIAGELRIQVPPLDRELGKIDGRLRTSGQQVFLTCLFTLVFYMNTYSTHSVYWCIGHLLGLYQELVKSSV